MGRDALNLPDDVKKEYVVEQPSLVLIDDLEGGGPLEGEKIPTFAKTFKEKMLHLGNAYVVMGKDRPAGYRSGKSMQTDCATIDLVTGRLGTVGSLIATEYPNAQVHSSTKLDAARIYISERTDVDDNFNLTPWYQNKGFSNNLAFNGSVKDKSAIAIKADNLRLMSREGIKIITMVDKLNSKNQRTTANYGIDLIGGLINTTPNSDLQPLVKGKNLVRCLMALQKSISDLDSHVAMHNKALGQIVSAFSTHIHLGGAGPTSPNVNPFAIAMCVSTSIDAMMSSVETGLKQYNHVSLEANYLKPGAKSYICSKFNNTT